MNTQKSLTQADKLELLRADLDRLDCILLETLRDRLKCCASIGYHKRENNISMMQPNRVAFVHDRVRKFGTENGMNTEFLRNIYELVIAEACRQEDEIINHSKASG